MNAVVYARESGSIDEGSPVSVQLSRCAEYARRLGCTKIDIYYDRGITGRRLDRPGLKAVLARIKEGEVDYFIFPALGCLSHKVREQWLLVKAIEELGIRVAAVYTPIPHPLPFTCLAANRCASFIH